MARVAADMSPLDLAYRAHVTPSTIYRIERGDVNPNRVTLRAVVDVLNLDPAEFGFDDIDAA